MAFRAAGLPLPRSRECRPRQRKQTRSHQQASQQPEAQRGAWLPIQVSNIPRRLRVHSKVGTSRRSCEKIVAQVSTCCIAELSCVAWCLGFQPTRKEIREIRSRPKLCCRRSRISTRRYRTISLSHALLSTDTKRVP